MRLPFQQCDEGKRFRRSLSVYSLCVSQVIGMHHAMVSAAATAAAHASGKSIHVWTCNTPVMMHAALEARVDAIVTDVPHQMLQVGEPGNESICRSRHSPCCSGQ